MQRPRARAKVKLQGHTLPFEVPFVLVLPLALPLPLAMALGVPSSVSHMFSDA